MNLPQQISNIISAHRLLNINEPVLVGVSGGADSVVLLYLLHNLGFHCIVAHCNFKLRGADADTDEQYVRQLADTLKCQCEVVDFDTHQYATDKGISVEMAARELRYRWFQQLCKQYHAQAVAVAHHANDLQETILLNILRGCGHNGLATMQYRSVVNNLTIVRPLLDITRVDIEQFAADNKLHYCTDCTNVDVKIPRNRIRNEVVPQLNIINPSFVETMVNNHRYWSEEHRMLTWAVEAWKHSVVLPSNREDIVIYDVEKLLQSPAPLFLLNELVRQYGFNSTQVDDILRCCNAHQPSCGERKSEFVLDGCSLTVERGKIIVKKYAPSVNHRFFVESKMVKKDIQVPHFNFKLGECSASFNINTHDKCVATFDADKITWPIEIRHWLISDEFQPFGMKGKKKVGDYFTDEKLFDYQRNEVLIVADADHILWIAGMRADGRKAITPKSKKYIEIHYIP